MQYFNIQVASQLSGVASATIRAWEKRYNAVLPDRGENGHRLYSEKDIEKLALLFRLTEVGQSIGKIAHLELDELKVVFSTLMHEPYVEKQIVTPHHEKLDYTKILNNLYIALAAYKVDIISHELDKARNMLTPRELCLNIIIPLFHEIGLKVERGELGVAQEHTLSALTSFYVGQMIGGHYQKVLQGEDLIILGAPKGELHEIGILASALLCVHYGFRFIFMGPNLPAESLAEAANALRCKAILLGTTRHELMAGYDLGQYLQDLQGSLMVKTEIWVGGNIQSDFANELIRKRISFFPSLHAFDNFLANIERFNHICRQ
ncbi:MAG TPA: MerR family transcriptional regulator [Bacteriovoracaceae bacterium]|nr:MerR family transcriptional regulator [Bacteriovoracaceae bacterium]